MFKKRLLTLLLAGAISASCIASDVAVFAEESIQTEAGSDDVSDTSEASDALTENTDTSSNTDTISDNTSEVSSDTDTDTTEKAEAVGTIEHPVTTSDELYNAIKEATGTESTPQEIYIKSKEQNSLYVPILLNHTIGIGTEESPQYIKLIAADQTIIGRNIENGESFSGHLFKVNNGSLEFDTADGGVLKIDGTNASSNTTPSFGSLVSIEGENSSFIMNDKVALTNNYTESHGGAIFNARGTVILNGGIITGNKITTNSSGQTYGGGILSSGLVKVCGNAKVSGNVRTTTMGNLISDNISFNCSEKYHDSAYLEITGDLTDEGKQIGVSVCFEPEGFTDYALVRSAEGVNLAPNISGKIKYDFDSLYTEKDGMLTLVTENIQPYGLSTDGTIYKAPTLNDGNSKGNAEILHPIWKDRTDVVLTGNYYCKVPVKIYSVVKEHSTGIQDTVSLKELVESDIQVEVNQDTHTYTEEIKNLDENKNYTVFFLAQSEDGALSVTAQFDYSELNEGRPEQGVQAETLKADDDTDPPVPPEPVEETIVSVNLLKKGTETETDPANQILIKNAEFSLVYVNEKQELEPVKDSEGKPITWKSSDQAADNMAFKSDLLKENTIYGIIEEKLANGLVINPKDSVVFFKYQKEEDPSSDSSAEETGQKPEDVKYHYVVSLTDEKGNTEKDGKPITYENAYYNTESGILSILNTDTSVTFVNKTCNEKTTAHVTLTVIPVLDAKGKVVDGKTSGSLSWAKSSKVYSLTDGVYSVASNSDTKLIINNPTFYIKVSDGKVTISDKDGKAAQNANVAIKNNVVTITYTRKYTITLSKIDESGKNLSGAKFSLTATINNKKLKATWDTSAKNPYKLNFEPGAYTFKETTVPRGYEKEKEFVLTVAKDGTLTVSSTSKNIKIDGYKVTITNIAGPTPTDTPTPTPTFTPKRPSVKKSTLTGLESPKKFYPNVMYPFTVTGAGTDNDNPHEGDIKWYPFYWTTKSSDRPADDYDAEQAVQNWKIGNKKGIQDAKTFNLYVWFRKFVYKDGEWVRDTSSSGKQRAIFQFRSAKVDSDIFKKALSGTPVPSDELSDGAITDGGDDPDDGSGTDKSNNKSSGKSVPKSQQNIKYTKVVGIEKPKKFYPGIVYPITVTGAGTENTKPKAGDEKWYPFYWTTDASDTPADDYNNEKAEQNWNIGFEKGISEAGTLELYVWCRRYVYKNGKWVRDESEDGKQRFLYQFEADEVDPKIFADALKGVPVPESELSEGAIRATNDDFDPDKKQKSKATGAKTGDDTPIVTMIILLLAAAAIISGIFALKKRKTR